MKSFTGHSRPLFLADGGAPAQQLLCASQFKAPEVSRGSVRQFLLLYSGNGWCGSTMFTTPPSLQRPDGVCPGKPPCHSNRTNFGTDELDIVKGNLSFLTAFDAIFYTISNASNNWCIKVHNITTFGLRRCLSVYACHLQNFEDKYVWSQPSVLKQITDAVNSKARLEQEKCSPSE